jgi:hypothetical protein
MRTSEIDVFPVGFNIARHVPSEFRRLLAYHSD